MYARKNRTVFFVRMDGSRKDVTIMGGSWKRFFAWVFVFVMLLSCGPALAEFSPRYTQMNAGNGLTLTIRMKAEALSPLSKAALETVNEWLDGAALTVTVGQNASADFSLLGECVLRADVQRKDDYALTTFSPDGGSYLTAADAADVYVRWAFCPSRCPKRRKRRTTSAMRSSTVRTASPAAPAPLSARRSVR